ncbi:MAG: hypothetical protein WBF48_04970 [Halarcobacter sp.]
MKFEDYDNTIQEVELKIENLLHKLKIRISVIRFICFQSLKLSESSPYRFIGAENYNEIDPNLQRIGKEKRTKIQIYYLGTSKIKKMKAEEIHEKISSLRKLEQLYFQHKYLSASYEAKAEEEYTDNWAYQITKLLKPEESMEFPFKGKELIDRMKRLNKYTDKKSRFSIFKDKHYTLTGELLKEEDLKYKS